MWLAGVVQYEYPTDVRTDIHTDIHTLHTSYRHPKALRCQPNGCLPPRGGGVTVPRIWGAVPRKSPLPPPRRAHAPQLGNVCPSPRGRGAPAPTWRGSAQATVHTSHTQTHIVVSPVPHIRGAGFDGGAAARDHRSLPWMAAPTSDREARGWEMSPYGVTRSPPPHVHRVPRYSCKRVACLGGRGSGCGF